MTFAFSGKPLLRHTRDTRTVLTCRCRKRRAAFASALVAGKVGEDGAEDGPSEETRARKDDLIKDQSTNEIITVPDNARPA